MSYVYTYILYTERRAVQRIARVYLYYVFYTAPVQ